MLQPYLQQWDEDSETLGVICDHSRAKADQRKNNIKKSRQEVLKSALVEMAYLLGQLQYTMTNTSDSSMGKEQCGAQAKGDEASSHTCKETHHMLQIFIKTPIIKPRYLCLQLSHDTTVSDLKDIIHNKLGIRPALQNLYTTNNQALKLCDASTLLDLGIEPETNIDLTLVKGLLGGAPTSDLTFLGTIARDLGTDWQQLAGKLRFKKADIDTFERLAEGNPEEQAFQMLVSWRRRQASEIESGEWLTSALIKTGRPDLASKILVAETFLGTLARDLGTDWQQLAGMLRFEPADIGKFESLAEGNSENQAFQMLVSWWRKQADEGEARSCLRSALIKTGHLVLASRIPVGMTFLGTLARDLGKDWQQLAGMLRFSKADSNEFESFAEGNQEKQAFQMLVSWWREQADDAEARSRLRSALTTTGHPYLASIIPVDEMFLRTLARDFGTDWQQLAGNLRFEPADIGKFKKSLAEGNPEEQAFQMLVSWWRKQADEGEARSCLRSALIKTGRPDLASRIPVGLTFLWTLAKDLGKDWQQLATKLRLRKADVNKFERLAEGNHEEQAFQMLVFWWRDRANEKDARKRLSSALIKMGHLVLASRILAAKPSAFPPLEARKRIANEKDELSPGTSVSNEKRSSSKETFKKLKSLEKEEETFPKPGSGSEESSSPKERNKNLKSLVKEENLPRRKPFKICKVKERTKVGVVAATLKELRTKIQTQFAPITDDFKIVLEEDCTRIEDEDYFKTLSDNTVLMVVSQGEQWTGASSSLEEELSMDFVEVDGKTTQEGTSLRLAQVARRIAENPAVLAFLPKVDLEVVADADLNELQVLLHQTKDNAEFIQDACERRLVDKIESDEATELLKLYHRVKTGESGSPKRVTRSSTKKSKETS